ncbi:MAG: hypothetical protein AB1529_03625 [Candidatus Micrarchaeota archaeon]
MGDGAGAERARPLLEGIEKRLEMEAEGADAAKAGLRGLRSELQSWLERGGTEGEFRNIERRALGLFNEFDRARFFGTHRIVRADLPTPERSEEAVTLSESDRVSGERALYGMLRSETMEEAWLYVEYTRGGRRMHAWYEIGEQETAETARTALSDIAAILSDIGPESIVSLSHYHIHPTAIKRRATVSNNDLSSFVFISENVARRFPGLAGRMDMKIVNEEGIYTLRGYDLRRFQDVTGRVLSDEGAMMKWFSIPFKTGTDFVRACREIGIEATFSQRGQRRLLAGGPRTVTP